MIRIEKANESNTEVLALLGSRTYVESHGSFIEDKNDLAKFIDATFSISKTKENLSNPKHHFFIVYVDDLPVGYAKLVLDAKNIHVTSQRSCRLDKIYILRDFIPLKIGQKLLDYVELRAKELFMETIWLDVYIENIRAIRFYEKNEFTKVGKVDFLVNGKAYNNMVLSKKIK